ncbi:DUF2071 domain-containing protein [Phycisphaeraceae bacterium D3-23]
MFLRHRAFGQVDHRPYPAVARPWAVSMVWRDLAFLHWPIAPDPMRAALPDGFEPDLFEGEAWLGVVPFVMDAVRPRLCPAVPQWMAPVSVSRFPELNVRTYVRHRGEPGVLFFSLDAASRWFVRAGRLQRVGVPGLSRPGLSLPGFALPYFHAAMSVTVDDSPEGWTHYTSVRDHSGAPPACFTGRYRPLPGSVPTPATPGTLEHFLTERYRLYSVDACGRTLVGEVHHAAWPLQPAECALEACAMMDGIALTLPEVPPIAHVAKRVEVVGWRPRLV